MLFRLVLGLDLISGSLVVQKHRYLYCFPFSLSLSRNGQGVGLVMGSSIPGRCEFQCDSGQVRHSSVMRFTPRFC